MTVGEFKEYLDCCYEDAELKVDGTEICSTVLNISAIEMDTTNNIAYIKLEE